MTITPELVVFFLLAAVSIGAAVGMLFSRNAVHSALYLVLNFAVVSVFFLMLAAPFIAMVQITVYAGAIMVLFLFVIMLLGAEVLRRGGGLLPWQTGLALVLAVLFIGALGYVVFLRAGPLAPLADVGVDYGDPASIGAKLFQDYLLPFELTSFLLLVAMIGAVVLTRDSKGRGIGNRVSNPGATSAIGAPAHPPATPPAEPRA